MIKKQISHIAGNHFSKLKKQAKKIMEKFCAEEIHQFRVEFKKLRAFLQMLSVADESAGKLKVSKNLKKFYKIAGAIRDLQLQQQRIKDIYARESKKPIAYLQILENEIELVKKELREIFSADLVNECKMKTARELPQQFTLENFNKYAKQKWNIIRSIIISRQWGDDDIHFIRKILKELFYNLEIYEGLEYNVLSTSLWKGKTKLYMDTLINDLGIFRDQCTAIALLKMHWLTRLDINTKQLLEDIKRQWIHDKIKLKDSLLKKMSNELFIKPTERLVII